MTDYEREVIANLKWCIFWILFIGGFVYAFYMVLCGISGSFGW